MICLAVSDEEVVDFTRSPFESAVYSVYIAQHSTDLYVNEGYLNLVLIGTRKRLDDCPPRLPQALSRASFGHAPQPDPEKLGPSMGTIAYLRCYEDSQVIIRRVRDLPLEKGYATGTCLTALKNLIFISRDKLTLRRRICSE